MSTQSHYLVPPPNVSELHLPVGFPSVGPLSLPVDLSPGATSRTRRTPQDGYKKGKNVKIRGRRIHKKGVRYQGNSHKRETTIDMLADHALLEIFDLWLNDFQSGPVRIEDWHTLVHVCRKWRHIVFASPRRLNLEIYCTIGTPVRKNLGVWPALPIHIDVSELASSSYDEDNIIAALEHPDRLRSVRLELLKGWLWEKVATVMQAQFPMLTQLHLKLNDGSAPALLASAKFLGGSAPRLQSISLQGIPFPALPTLLLSTGDLVFLYLYKIPATGYMSPEAIVEGLAALPRLEEFVIKFQSATSRPNRTRLPPVTRTVLPALTYFAFKGASEYLEDLVTQIDSPQLNRIFIDYLNQCIDFQAAQLSKFINRSMGPESTLFKHARVTFFSDRVSFHMYPNANHPSMNWNPANTDISCEGIDWQVFHMAQLLSHFSATLTNVVHLNVEDELSKGRQEVIEDVEWPLLLLQFSNVRTLYVSQGFARHVALALEDMPEEMFTEALPSLDLICLEGQTTSSIENFVAARRRSGHPVTVADTKTEFNERLAS